MVCFERRRDGTLLARVGFVRSRQVCGGLGVRILTIRLKARGLESLPVEELTGRQNK